MPFPRYRDFEIACHYILAKYLNVHEADVSKEERLDRRVVDFLVKSGGETVIAEAKLYRSSRVPTAWLRQAAAQLFNLSETFQATSRVLMISARLTAVQRASLVEIVSVLDYHDLYRLASDNIRVLEILDSVILEDQNEVADQVAELPGKSRPTTLQLGILHQGVKGDLLCATLRGVPRGRGNVAANKYERAVQEVLEYVFGTELTKWRRQRPTDDLLRRDIVAKITGSHSFWIEIVRDFRTRFVTFECKNYSTKVTQEEVYSTEKYLHKNALRSFAVIVSRDMVTKSAIVAMKGALRESGRLITWLCDDDLCDMLSMRDSGGEIYDILAERIDKMLLEIAR